jgi:hypothetical protein
LLTIGAGQQAVLDDPCTGRRFMTALIAQLDKEHAGEIVIDKSYSPQACPDAAGKENAAINGAFLAAIANSDSDKVGIPVIAGNATLPRTDGSTDTGCLQLAPSLLPLPTIAADPAAARHGTTGLLRIDSDPLRIPLRFPAFRDDLQGTYPTLSLLAAERVEPDLERHTGLKAYRGDNFPFTSFVRYLPQAPALAILCRNGVSEPEWGDCGAALASQAQAGVPPIDVAQKIVVIGDEMPEQDVKPFPGGDRYGVELQANYIESLLDGRFLKPMNFLVDLLCFLVLLTALHFVQASQRDKWKSFAWSLATLATFFLLGVAAMTVLGYYPPVKSLIAVFLNPFLSFGHALGHEHMQEESPAKAA